MGGNALKQFNVRRVSANTFQLIKSEVMAKLGARVPGLVIEALQSYAFKPDFGNLSLFFVSHGPEADAMVRAQAETLATREGTARLHSRAEHGGDRFSFIYNDLQVDLTSVRSENFDLALAYHAYNGLGGLVGQVASDLGLVLRDTGLSYKLMNGDQLLEDIVVASKWNTILTLLGYDAARWELGFKNLEDIFAFVTSSQYFQASSFLSVDVPVQDERPTIAQLFAAYLQEHPQTVESGVAPAGDVTFLTDRIPGLHQRIEAALATHAQVRAAAEKLNGNLVRTWTGREGRALGDLMQRLRQEFNGEAGLRQWVLSATGSEIQTKVETLHCLP